jgi:sugar/nucleoside kinase (ribokinase family)
MSLDLLTFGEALVEVMRTEVDIPLDHPGTFTGPYPSGAPFIFTVQAARLGAQAAAVGAVGADAFGECFLKQLVADGINTRGVRVLPDHATGVAFIAYREDGGRDFLFHARHAAAGQISPASLDKVLFEGLRCLHVTGSSLALHKEAMAMGLKALDMAQAAGAKISFDPNIRLQLISPEQARERFQPFMDAADVILPTAEELRILTGDNPENGAAALLAHKPHCIIVVSAGADGCDVYREENYATKHTHIPGYAVTEVDPTGAGDCFDAGFLVRWLAGDSPEEAAQFANACGALAVTERGPMAGAKHTTEVWEFMEKF